ncbi:MAG TPA: hypothetical protein VNS63_00950 [Blastocatellia bacterium]|nr:hypothetical protein [Blastocatellia bacterium]
MSRRSIAIILVLLAYVGSASAGSVFDGNKVDQIGALAEPGASDSLKKALEVAGWRVSLADGAYCDIWLRAGVPPGKTDAQGAVYTSLGESALVGVIAFARATTDFRGQPLKPGVYTLRYGLHPTDGNHMGISPIRDFLVMVPVALDTNPDAQFKFEDLIKMSAKASGTNHPAVLSLASAEKAAAPKIASNEHGQLVFSSKLKTQSGSDLPIAFVVKGIAEQ